MQSSMKNDEKQKLFEIRIFSSVFPTAEGPIQVIHLGCLYCLPSAPWGPHLTRFQTHHQVLN